MKWTTANVKNPNYTANHELYVGTNTGSFKKIVPVYEENPFAQRSLYDLKELDGEARVSALTFANDTAEILIGRTNKQVQLYSLRTDQVTRTVNVKTMPVVGVARYEDQLIAGLGNGEVQRIDLTLEDATAQDEHVIVSGNNMAHMRQCPVQKNLVATGGKERQNNLKVFDLAADGKQLFSSKNLPNDYLQLEVPVWDSDLAFIDSPHVLGTCSRHGYVRIYDTRKQRRPVQYFATEDQMSFTTMVAQGNYIYTGTTMGALKAFDIRRMKTFVHTYKGFTGAISNLSLDSSGKYLASASLDRYVRVHHADSTVLLYQCYVKSKATSVLIRESLEDPNARTQDDIEQDEGVETNSKKHNKPVVSDDKEYEDMFDNMQTVCEGDDTDDASENEGPSKSEETTPKSGAKRKSSKNPNKPNKKKRN